MRRSMVVLTLWALLLLFVLRVAGQLLVFQGWAPWLPPMGEWYSGLIPYRPLLLSQLVIVGLYAKACLDVTRGRGFFAAPRAGLGRGLLIFGGVYLAAMVLRYALRMSLHPDARWTGGSIPIFFHWVLAAFLLVLGRYHRRAGAA